ncbi:Hint domain-containing protein [Ruegeria conchae]|uniref:Hint domain-containing protein n=1 Tax=Ruegeria conchae TaxID=981384 RepID=UPI0021A2CFB8|nr:Hint domain-containing protein [Ruegeria conchae]UWR03548.1 Hint domain-containing protein [Ruegeria conchae]
MVSIVGDTTGSVTDDPPNVATGDLDITSGATIVSQDWSIQTPPDHGTASIDPATGEWTYTVDPTFFDSLDNGEIVTDTFTVEVNAVVSVFGFNFNAAPETTDVTITIEGVCFTAGTLIETEVGSQPIETLQVNDEVLTADHGLQPIRWIESSRLDRGRLRANPSMRPVRLTAGSLGLNIPSRDLLVSQQHRILISGPKVQMLFGAPEVLVAAKHLCSWPGIGIETSDQPVEYLHILLDRHEILTAEGAPAESLFLGEETLYTLSSDALQELVEIFPDRATDEHNGFGNAARLILREHEARALA